MLQHVKMLAMTSAYPCPCCGYLTFDEPPGSNDICPICFWEDDVSQLRFASMDGGANKVSLMEAQQNYLSFGACEERVKQYVRLPHPDEVKDQNWRVIDPEIDNIEVSLKGVNYHGTYPAARCVLYYWRPTYWRLKKG